MGEDSDVVGGEGASGLEGCEVGKDGDGFGEGWVRWRFAGWWGESEDVMFVVDETG